jgi:hypothetical protein
MIHVALEREWEPAMTEQGFWQMAEEAGLCLPIYRGKWVESYLATDGSRLVCHMTAPDMESVRSFLHQTKTRYVAVWCGEPHSLGLDLLPNVLVERSFDKPVTLDSIQAIEDAGAQCLEMRSVTFTSTLFSADKTRMLCLYHAPDAQSVRDAQQEAGMPLDRVWPCQYLCPPGA